MQIIRRLMRVATSIQAVSIFLLTFLPRVAATNETGSLDYTARQPFNNEADEVKSDIESMVTLFHFKSWIHRGRQIRDQNDRAHCIGNLSLALSQVGPLTSYSSQGASGALSLLPTAGALIGAPAKELWVLYKLMPLAGILSMILSLGGNIVPMDATDYELSSTAFAYGGLIATQEKHIERRKNEIDFKTAYVSPAETFANRVEKRAQERRGSTKRFIVFVGICFQISWFCILMFACYFAQSGGVVAWWCKAWGWMFLWYIMVVLSSLLENFAGVPFSKQWTIRVSAAPKIRISDSAPIVTMAQVSSAVNDSHEFLEDIQMSRENSALGTDGGIPTLTNQPGSARIQAVRKGAYAPVPKQRPNMERTGSGFTSQSHTHRGSEPWLSQHVDSVIPLTAADRTNTGESSIVSVNETLLQDLDTGYNTTGRVFMDPDEPFSVPRTPFYAIISLDKISQSHAALRVLSKAITVGVFAAGTATFASATLITISVALTTLCLVLGAGVFGRVAALWMASEMMQTDPVLHKVVQNRQEATEYIDAILRKPGLVFEVMGHVIINGRCVCRMNKWFRWCTLFGVLAPPFNVANIALRQKR